MVSEQSVDALRATVRRLRYRDGGLRDLARRAGVSYSWLTKFATGRTRNEKIDTLRRIARLFPNPAPVPAPAARAGSLPASPASPASPAGQASPASHRAAAAAHGVSHAVAPSGPSWRPR
jgi:transcriptional regulator with XRE-family HTH domain